MNPLLIAKPVETAWLTKTFVGRDKSGPKVGDEFIRAVDVGVDFDCRAPVLSVGNGRDAFWRHFVTLFDQLRWDAETMPSMDSIPVTPAQSRSVIGVQASHVVE